MFSLLVVKTDHYLSNPLANFDPCHSTFRGSHIQSVPVIRIFGATPLGQKCCLHVHGVFPYLLISYDGSETLSRLPYILASALDRAINVSLGQSDSNKQHVFKITPVSGIPFYGFHAQESIFLKIFFYNPLTIKKAVELLQNGAVLGKSFQSYESHVSYIQQFLMDNNIHGMSFIHLDACKFRRITDDTANCKKSIYHRQNSPETMQASCSDNHSMKCLKYWNPAHLDEELLMPVGIEKMSSCNLELDAKLSNITNGRNVKSDIAANPGLSYIWEDEMTRMNISSSKEGALLPTPSPPRTGLEKSDSEEKFRQILKEKLSKLNSEKGFSCEQITPTSLNIKMPINSFLPDSISVGHTYQENMSPENSQHLKEIGESTVDESAILSLSQKVDVSCLMDSQDVELMDIMTKLAEGNQLQNNKYQQSALALNKSVLETSHDNINYASSDEEESMIMSQPIEHLLNRASINLSQNEERTVNEDKHSVQLDGPVDCASMDVNASSASTYKFSSCHAQKPSVFSNYKYDSDGSSCFRITNAVLKNDKVCDMCPSEIAQRNVEKKVMNRTHKSSEISSIDEFIIPQFDGGSDVYSKKHKSTSHKTHSADMSQTIRQTFTKPNRHASSSIQSDVRKRSYKSKHVPNSPNYNHDSYQNSNVYVPDKVQSKHKMIGKNTHERSSDNPDIRTRTPYNNCEEVPSQSTNICETTIIDKKSLSAEALRKRHTKRDKSKYTSHSKRQVHTKGAHTTKDSSDSSQSDKDFVSNFNRSRDTYKGTNEPLRASPPLVMKKQEDRTKGKSCHDKHKRPRLYSESCDSDYSCPPQTPGGFLADSSFVNEIDHFNYNSKDINRHKKRIDPLTKKESFPSKTKVSGKSYHEESVSIKKINKEELKERPCIVMQKKEGESLKMKRLFGSPSPTRDIILSNDSFSSDELNTSLEMPKTPGQYETEENDLIFPVEGNKQYDDTLNILPSSFDVQDDFYPEADYTFERPPTPGKLPVFDMLDNQDMITSNVQYASHSTCSLQNTQLTRNDRKCESKEKCTTNMLDSDRNLNKTKSSSMKPSQQLPDQKPPRVNNQEVKKLTKKHESLKKIYKTKSTSKASHLTSNQVSNKKKSSNSTANEANTKISSKFVNDVGVKKRLVTKDSTTTKNLKNNKLKSHKIAVTEVKSPRLTLSPQSSTTSLHGSNMSHSKSSVTNKYESTSRPYVRTERSISELSDFSIPPPISPIPPTPNRPSRSEEFPFDSSAFHVPDPVSPFPKTPVRRLSYNDSKQKKFCDNIEDIAYAELSIPPLISPLPSSPPGSMDFEKSKGNSQKVNSIRTNIIDTVSLSSAMMTYPPLMSPLPQTPLHHREYELSAIPTGIDSYSFTATPVSMPSSIKDTPKRLVRTLSTISLGSPLCDPITPIASERTVDSSNFSDSILFNFKDFVKDEIPDEQMVNEEEDIDNSFFHISKDEQDKAIEAICLPSEVDNIVDTYESELPEDKDEERDYILNTQIQFNDLSSDGGYSDQENNILDDINTSSSIFSPVDEASMKSSVVSELHDDENVIEGRAILKDSTLQSNLSIDNEDISSTIMNSSDKSFLHENADLQYNNENVMPSNAKSTFHLNDDVLSSANIKVHHKKDIEHASSQNDKIRCASSHTELSKITDSSKNDVEMFTPSKENIFLPDKDINSHDGISDFTDKALSSILVDFNESLMCSNKEYIKDATPEEINNSNQEDVVFSEQSSTQSNFGAHNTICKSQSKESISNSDLQHTSDYFKVESLTNSLLGMDKQITIDANLSHGNTIPINEFEQNYNLLNSPTSHVEQLKNNEASQMHEIAHSSILLQCNKDLQINHLSDNCLINDANINQQGIPLEVEVSSAGTMQKNSLSHSSESVSTVISSSDVTSPSNSLSFSKPSTNSIVPLNHNCSVDILNTSLSNNQLSEQQQAVYPLNNLAINEMNNQDVISTYSADNESLQGGHMGVLFPNAEEKYLKHKLADSSIIVHLPASSPLIIPSIPNQHEVFATNPVSSAVFSTRNNVSASNTTSLVNTLNTVASLPNEQCYSLNNIATPQKTPIHLRNLDSNFNQAIPLDTNIVLPKTSITESSCTKYNLRDEASQNVSKLDPQVFLNTGTSIVPMSLKENSLKLTSVPSTLSFTPYSNATKMSVPITYQTLLASPHPASTVEWTEKHQLHKPSTQNFSNQEVQKSNTVLPMETFLDPRNLPVVIPHPSNKQSSGISIPKVSNMIYTPNNYYGKPDPHHSPMSDAIYGQSKVLQCLEPVSDQMNKQSHTPKKGKLQSLLEAKSHDESRRLHEGGNFQQPTSSLSGNFMPSLSNSKVMNSMITGKAFIPNQSGSKGFGKSYIFNNMTEFHHPSITVPFEKFNNTVDQSHKSGNPIHNTPNVTLASLADNNAFKSFNESNTLSMLDSLNKKSHIQPTGPVLPIVLNDYAIQDRATVFKNLRQTSNYGRTDNNSRDLTVSRGNLKMDYNVGKNISPFIEAHTELQQETKKNSLMAGITLNPVGYEKSSHFADSKLCSTYPYLTAVTSSNISNPISSSSQYLRSFMGDQRSQTSGYRVQYTKSCIQNNPYASVNKTSKILSPPKKFVETKNVINSQHPFYNAKPSLKSPYQYHKEQPFSMPITTDGEIGTMDLSAGQEVYHPALPINSVNSYPGSSSIHVQNFEHEKNANPLLSSVNFIHKGKITYGSKTPALTRDQITYENSPIEKVVPSLDIPSNILDFEKTFPPSQNSNIYEQQLPTPAGHIRVIRDSPVPINKNAEPQNYTLEEFSTNDSSTPVLTPSPAGTQTSPLSLVLNPRLNSNVNGDDLHKYNSQSTPVRNVLAMPISNHFINKDSTRPLRKRSITSEKLSSITRFPLQDSLQTPTHMITDNEVRTILSTPANSSYTSFNMSTNENVTSMNWPSSQESVQYPKHSSYKVKDTDKLSQINRNHLMAYHKPIPVKGHVDSFCLPVSCSSSMNEGHLEQVSTYNTFNKNMFVGEISASKFQNEKMRTNDRTWFDENQYREKEHIPLSLVCNIDSQYKDENRCGKHILRTSEQCIPDRHLYMEKSVNSVVSNESDSPINVVDDSPKSDVTKIPTAQMTDTAISSFKGIESNFMQSRTLSKVCRTRPDSVDATLPSHFNTLSHSPYSSYNLIPSSCVGGFNDKDLQLTKASSLVSTYSGFNESDLSHDSNYTDLSHQNLHLDKESSRVLQYTSMAEKDLQLNKEMPQIPSYTSLSEKDFHLNKASSAILLEKESTINTPDTDFQLECSSKIRKFYKKHRNSFDNTHPEVETPVVSTDVHEDNLLSKHFSLSSMNILDSFSSAEKNSIHFDSNMSTCEPTEKLLEISNNEHSLLSNHQNSAVDDNSILLNTRYESDTSSLVYSTDKDTEESPLSSDVLQKSSTHLSLKEKINTCQEPSVQMKESELDLNIDEGNRSHVRNDESDNESMNELHDSCIAGRHSSSSSECNDEIPSTPALFLQDKEVLETSSGNTRLDLLESVVFNDKTAMAPKHSSTENVNCELLLVQTENTSRRDAEESILDENTNGVVSSNKNSSALFANDDSILEVISEKKRNKGSVSEQYNCDKLTSTNSNVTDDNYLCQQTNVNENDRNTTDAMQFNTDENRLIEKISCDVSQNVFVDKDDAISLNAGQSFTEIQPVADNHMKPVIQTKAFRKAFPEDFVSSNNIGMPTKKKRGRPKKVVNINKVNEAKYNTPLKKRLLNCQSKSHKIDNVQDTVQFASSMKHRQRRSGTNKSYKKFFSVEDIPNLNINQNTTLLSSVPKKQTNLPRKTCTKINKSKASIISLKEQTLHNCVPKEVLPIYSTLQGQHTSSLPKSDHAPEIFEQDLSKPSILCNINDNTCIKKTNDIPVAKIAPSKLTMKLMQKDSFKFTIKKSLISLEEVTASHSVKNSVVPEELKNQENYSEIIPSIISNPKDPLGIDTVEKTKKSLKKKISPNMKSLIDDRPHKKCKKVLAKKLHSKNKVFEAEDLPPYTPIHRIQYYGPGSTPASFDEFGLKLILKKKCTTVKTCGRQQEYDTKSKTEDALSVSSQHENVARHVEKEALKCGTKPKQQIPSLIIKKSTQNQFLSMVKEGSDSLSQNIVQSEFIKPTVPPVKIKLGLNIAKDTLQTDVNKNPIIKKTLSELHSFRKVPENIPVRMPLKIKLKTNKNKISTMQSSVGDILNIKSPGNLESFVNSSQVELGRSQKLDSIETELDGIFGSPMKRSEVTITPQRLNDDELSAILDECNDNRSKSIGHNVGRLDQHFSESVQVSSPEILPLDLSISTNQVDQKLKTATKVMLSNLSTDDIEKYKAPCNKMATKTACHGSLKNGLNNNKALKNIKALVKDPIDLNQQGTSMLIFPKKRPADIDLPKNNRASKRAKTNCQELNYVLEHSNPKKNFMEKYARSQKEKKCNEKENIKVVICPSKPPQLMVPNENSIKSFSPPSGKAAPRRRKTNNSHLKTMCCIWPENVEKKLNNINEARLITEEGSSQKHKLEDNMSTVKTMNVSSCEKIAKNLKEGSQQALNIEGKCYELPKTDIIHDPYAFDANDSTSTATNYPQNRSQTNKRKLVSKKGGRKKQAKCEDGENKNMCIPEDFAVIAKQQTSPIEVIEICEADISDITVRYTENDPLAEIIEKTSKQKDEENNATAKQVTRVPNLSPKAKIVGVTNKLKKNSGSTDNKKYFQQTDTCNSKMKQITAKLVRATNEDKEKTTKINDQTHSNINIVSKNAIQCVVALSSGKPIVSQQRAERAEKRSALKQMQATLQPTKLVVKNTKKNNEQLETSLDEKSMHSLSGETDGVITLVTANKYECLRSRGSISKISVKHVTKKLYNKSNLRPTKSKKVSLPKQYKWKASVGRQFKLNNSHTSLNNLKSCIHQDNEGASNELNSISCHSSTIKLLPPNISSITSEKGCIKLISNVKTTTTELPPEKELRNQDINAISPIVENSLRTSVIEQSSCVDIDNRTENKLISVLIDENITLTNDSERNKQFSKCGSNILEPTPVETFRKSNLKSKKSRKLKMSNSLWKSKRRLRTRKLIKSYSLNMKQASLNNLENLIEDVNVGLLDTFNNIHQSSITEIQPYDIGPSVKHSGDDGPSLKSNVKQLTGEVILEKKLNEKSFRQNETQAIIVDVASVHVEKCLKTSEAANQLSCGKMNNSSQESLPDKTSKCPESLYNETLEYSTGSNKESRISNVKEQKQFIANPNGEISTTSGKGEIHTQPILSDKHYDLSPKVVTLSKLCMSIIGTTVNNPINKYISRHIDRINTCNSSHINTAGKIFKDNILTQAIPYSIKSHNEKTSIEKELKNGNEVIKPIQCEYLNSGSKEINVSSKVSTSSYAKEQNDSGNNVTPANSANDVQKSDASISSVSFSKLQEDDSHNIKPKESTHELEKGNDLVNKAMHLSDLRKDDGSDSITTKTSLTNSNDNILIDTTKTNSAENDNILIDTTKTNSAENAKSYISNCSSKLPNEKTLPEQSEQQIFVANPSNRCAVNDVLYKSHSCCGQRLNTVNDSEALSLTNDVEKAGIAVKLNNDVGDASIDVKLTNDVEKGGEFAKLINEVEKDDENVKLTNEVEKVSEAIKFDVHGKKATLSAETKTVLNELQTSITCYKESSPATNKEYLESNVRSSYSNVKTKSKVNHSDRKSILNKSHHLPSSCNTTKLVTTNTNSELKLNKVSISSIENCSIIPDKEKINLRSDGCITAFYRSDSILEPDSKLTSTEPVQLINKSTGESLECKTKKNTNAKRRLCTALHLTDVASSNGAKKQIKGLKNPPDPKQDNNGRVQSNLTTDSKTTSALFKDESKKSTTTIVSPSPELLLKSLTVGQLCKPIVTIHPEITEKQSTLTVSDKINAISKLKAGCIAKSVITPKSKACKEKFKTKDAVTTSTEKVPKRLEQTSSLESKSAHKKLLSSCLKKEKSIGNRSKDNGLNLLGSAVSCSVLLTDISHTKEKVAVTTSLVKCDGKASLPNLKRVGAIKQKQLNIKNVIRKSLQSISKRKNFPSPTDTEVEEYCPIPLSSKNLNIVEYIPTSICKTRINQGKISDIEGYIPQPIVKKANLKFNIPPRRSSTEEKLLKIKKKEEMYHHKSKLKKSNLRRSYSRSLKEKHTIIAKKDSTSVIEKEQIRTEKPIKQLKDTIRDPVLLKYKIVSPSIPDIFSSENYLEEDTSLASICTNPCSIPDNYKGSLLNCNITNLEEFEGKFQNHGVCRWSLLSHKLQPICNAHINNSGAVKPSKYDETAEGSLTKAPHLLHK